MLHVKVQLIHIQTQCQAKMVHHVHLHGEKLSVIAHILSHMKAQTRADLKKDTAITEHLVEVMAHVTVTHHHEAATQDEAHKDDLHSNRS